MVVKGVLAGVAAALVSMSALADVVTLTFEGVGDGAYINNFYNGGKDSLLNQGPINYGVTFSSNAVALKEGPFSQFLGEPSKSTVMAFDTGTFAAFDLAAGFTTGFSFYYSSQVTGSIKVFSGLDGTGTQLGTTISLLSQASTGCSSAAFCNWTPVGVSFTGLAKSVVFTGQFSQTAFDNVTFGCASAVPGSCAPTNNDPEPGSLALVGLALASLGLMGRKSKG